MHESWKKNLIEKLFLKEMPQFSLINNELILDTLKKNRLVS